MHSPPTGSSNRILSSSTADSSGNTHSHQRSSTNSVSTLGFPMSISDEGALNFEYYVCIYSNLLVFPLPIILQNQITGALASSPALHYGIPWLT